ncbi:hypothetical protein LPMP_282490 [Leishmania panamensis]|uniref:Uncharacterized protein n=7 Tax=Viannia TaxID=37616 RepID=A4HGT9_LEIBR|nr:conserved hypothetical protein [Leishmania braziliensis MHOM/BR/75/M2904]XP_010700589.1 hypothetical protein LPMP_282490 [Leishmania panamensis]KAI5685877.1 hypothetical protein MNV84_05379 [Leishmania braziliensis]CCM17083.1 hypothetical protein, conserved [Leishmania guyanensis]AIN99882.1 hypothetical protein LPMP_282490 [Leishmania panamensis]CAJ2476054.1 unnamed protein product [Leishmania braziliensis]CAJ2476525.1 unnamed protein product [Leishmania braziliensis]
MAFRGSSARLAATPGVGIAPETTPVKYVPEMLNIQNAKWWNGRHKPVYRSVYNEKSWLQKARWGAFIKGSRPVMRQRYSAAALKEALEMVPEGFETCDVPRPPQRIRAQSEGVVGRWYTNYWTLHSVRYQCQLAEVEWPFGERQRPRTNYDEPYMYTDFEETKAIRDYRSRWINVNRSLVGMSKRMKEAEEESRYLHFKKVQDTFWSNRKVLVNRIKSMHNQGTLQSAKDLPLKSINIKAFLAE